MNMEQTHREEGEGGDSAAIPFEFNGKAGEYFKIWIVNVALSIITLGIYSAWAKVRTNQYIYGNTLLDGTAFRYTADPRGILRGRLIAVALMVIYVAVQQAAPQYFLIVMLAFGALLPWLIVKSLRFRARYTQYRNISFHFSGTYRDALVNFILLYLLVPLTLGLIIPYINYRQKKFIVKGNGYGTTSFDFLEEHNSFYTVYLTAFLMLIVLGAALMFPMYRVFDYMSRMVQGGEAGKADDFPMQMLYILPVIYMVIVPAYFFIWTFIRVKIFNLVMNGTALSRLSFKSTQRVRDVFWIYVSNFFVMVFTLGLMIPWGMIRLTRYRVSNLALVAGEDLDNFIAAKNESVGYAGEEIGEAFDIDIGF